MILLEKVKAVKYRNRQFFAIYSDGQEIEISQAVYYQLRLEVAQ